MQELEQTWGRIGRAFWLFFWRLLVAAAIAGALTSFFLGWLLTPLFGQLMAAQMVGIVVWPPLALFMFKAMFRKRYKEFRIAFVAIEPGAD